MNGASAIGLVYDEGVMIAADNLASFGAMAKFRNCPRVKQMNKNTIVGVSGDYGDFQHVWKLIEQKQIEEESDMDGKISSPGALHTWLTRLQYNKRCNFDPYWVEWIVGGIKNDEPFLGYVDKLGTSYQDKAIATGRLRDVGLPTLREHTENLTAKLNEQQAREVVHKAMQSLFYADAWTTNKFTLGIVSKDKGARVEGPFQLKENWKPVLRIEGTE